MRSIPRLAYALLAPAMLACCAASLPALAQDADMPAPDAALSPHPSLAILAQPVAPLSLGDAMAADADAQADDIVRGIDAAIAQSIAATGAFTGLGTMDWGGKPSDSRAVVVNGYSRLKGAMFPDPGLQWSQLGRQDFGSSNGLAIGLENKFADSRTVATQVRLRHSTGPIDVRVNLRGAKPLASSDPMNVTYDSSAIYKVGSALELGMIARGSLGSLGDFGLSDRQQDAGAIARLKLLGKAGGLSAETGYDRKLGPGTDNLPGRFHMNLNFNWKL